MKLNEKMRFPHPVLTEYNDDYIDSDFDASFEHQITENEQLKITSYLSLRCSDLQDLIEDGKASSGYYLVCRETFFNSLHGVALGIDHAFFDKSKLFGAVSIRPVIWTNKDITGYTSPLINCEFGKDISIPRGSIISMGSEFRFSLDPQKFKPFETIFATSINDDVRAGGFKVDIDNDSITICADTATFKKISEIRNVKNGSIVLLNTVYLPVVMEVILNLKEGDMEITGRRWYRVFKSKCDELGIDLDSKNLSPLEAAQKLLKYPLSEIDRIIDFES